MQNKNLSQLLLLIILLVVGPHTNAQGTYDDTLAPAIVHVQGNIYTIKGGLGNVALISTDKEILMVDTKADTVKFALQKLLAETFSGKRLKYIINTHMHWDHTGGNDLLCNGCSIIAHKNARDSTDIKWPDITFDSVLHIYFNGEEIILTHYPHSHTDHDVVVYFTRSKVLVMGDMYFSGMYPFIGSGGSLQGLIKNIGTIISIMPQDVKIIPGHGPVSGISDLIATREMLIETSAFIQRKIDAKVTLEQALKEGLPGWNAKWGKGYCKEACWIKTVYKSLTKSE